VLLLALAGVMVGIADFKKSEVLAVFAILLAYYTSIITHVGLFTLYSNIVLTAAAVYFLVRNRWAALTLACLAATYASYGYWRFFNGDEWRLVGPEEGLTTGIIFLAGYWMIFTAGGFLSRDEKFAGANRASFLTANNGAFFALFILTMWQVHHGGFWKFSLGYGSTLLALAVLASVWFKSEPLTKNALLTQGLLLVTLGFITKYSGLKLGLILGLESVVLLLLSQQRASTVLKVGALVTAALAVGVGMDGMHKFDSTGMWEGIGLGVMMMFGAWLSHRQPGPVKTPVFRWLPAYFTTLALMIWFTATYDNTTAPRLPLVLAAEALVLVASIYLLRLPEVSLLGQAYLALAQVIWAFDVFTDSIQIPWWQSAVMLVLALAMGQWWRKQEQFNLRNQSDPGWQLLDMLPVAGKNLVLVAGAWLAVRLAGLLAVGLTVYGVVTRAWFLAVFGGDRQERPRSP
jgi:hypothetical protein